MGRETTSSSQILSFLDPPPLLILLAVGVLEPDYFVIGTGKREDVSDAVL